jgi:undecaprenyl-phosphate galactose phosphotransferase
MEPDSDHLLYELLESDPEIKKDWDKYMKLKVDDPRVTTKTAKLIRKLSIDELPQLWNVFNGDMSLVGPRPILEREKNLLGDSYKNYIKTRPGITGLWQVSGRNDTSFQRRIYMDNWYIRNWSIWGDIVILIKTLKVVFKGSGSY